MYIRITKHTHNVLGLAFSKDVDTVFVGNPKITASDYASLNLIRTCNALVSFNAKVCV